MKTPIEFFDSNGVCPSSTLLNFALGQCETMQQVWDTAPVGLPWIASRKGVLTEEEKAGARRFLESFWDSVPPGACWKDAEHHKNDAMAKWLRENTKPNFS